MRDTNRIFVRSSSELKTFLQTQDVFLSLCQVEETTDENSQWLEMREGRVTLVHPLGVLSLDFLTDARYLRQSHRGKNELLAKALGRQRGITTVFDATLGLAEDAVFMTQLGFQVRGCERSPWVYLLLKDAERRATAQRADFSLEIIFGSAQKIFAEMQTDFSLRPPMIYIDPMFPEKKKTALPRKEMQIFRDIVGEDEDADELLASALRAATEGVVVKRPLKATVLGARPSHSFKGKTIRYDLYSVK